MYRDDAQKLMAAAARNGAVARDDAPGPQQQRRQAAPSVTPEARRPLPYPEPVGVNDNLDDDDEDVPVRQYRRRLSIPRLIARIVIAPLYITVALLAIAMIALFARSFLGT